MEMNPVIEKFLKPSRELYVQTKLPTKYDDVPILHLQTREGY